MTSDTAPAGPPAALHHALHRPLRQIANAGRVVLFVAHALAWLALARARFAPRLRARGLEALLRATGTSVTIHGTPALTGTLLVVNHVSWLDIVILARACNTAAFVAKAEVARWPLLGALARRAGCVFVARDRRAHARQQAQSLHDALAQGRSVILFAEGTTGTGERLLPFRSSLFPSSEAFPVQPLAITYKRPDGTPLAPEQRRRIAWLGDDALLPHLAHLLRAGACRAEVRFGAPFVAQDRKAAADRCRDEIATAIVR